MTIIETTIRTEDIAYSPTFVMWKRQFLCHFPLHLIKWDHPLYQECSFQWAFLIKVLNWAMDQQLLPNVSLYVLPFLKLYFKSIENANKVVLDELYQHYITFQLTPTTSHIPASAALPSLLMPNNKLGQGYLQKTWWIHDTLWVQIWEHSHMVHSGTTGLRTWPASLALIEFIYRNPTLLRSLPSLQSMVELGAGAGLLSFFFSLLYPSCHVTCTDIHPSVLQLLSVNASGFPRVHVKSLDFESQRVDPSTTDLVVCADVMYDRDTSPLFRALPPDVPCLLAYTHRHTENNTLSWLTSPPFCCQWQGQPTLFPSDEPQSMISIYSRHLPDT